MIKISASKSRIINFFVVTNILSSCAWLDQGTGKLTLINPSVTTKSLVDTMRTSALAIGDEILTELGDNLSKAGLTQTESKIILDSTRLEISNATSSISIESLGLLSTNVIKFIIGPSVRGAIRSLDENGTNLEDLNKRVLISQVIMESTVGSLGGRTTDLTVADVMNLQKEMVGTGIETLNEGGLANEMATKAVKAITSGATASLGKSIEKMDASNAAANIVAGAVEKLGSDGIPTASIQDLVGAVVEGVVGQLKKTGAPDPAEAASLVAKSSVVSLSVLVLPLESLIAATEGAARGAVSALTAAGVAKDAIALAAQKVASSSASVLTRAGITAENIGKAAGAIASGAIQGLGNAGLSTDEITASKSISAIISGAAQGLGTGGISSDQVSSALGDVAGNAITAIAKLVPISGSVASIQEEIISEIIQGTITAAISEGIISSSNVSSITSTIAKGAGNGLATLAQAGVVVANTQTLIQNATQEILTQQQTNIGLDPATIQTVASTAGQTAETAKNVAIIQKASSEPSICATIWPDDMTDSVFETVIKSLEGTPSCKAEGVAPCPKARTFNTEIAEWVKNLSTGLCSLSRTTLPTSGSTSNPSQSPTPSPQSSPPASGDTMVSCSSILDAEGMITGQKISYLSVREGLPHEKSCNKGTLNSCPYLSSDLLSEGYQGPWITTLQGSTACVYFQPLSCEDAFVDNPSHDAMTLSLSPHSDRFGDLSCLVPAASTCPILTGDVSLYEYSSESTAGSDGLRLCSFIHIEPSCDTSIFPQTEPPTLKSAIITQAVFDAMTLVAKAPNDGRVCRLENGPRFYVIDAPLKQQGFVVQQFPFQNGIRLMLTKKEWICPIDPSHSSLSLDDLRSMALSPDFVSKSCDTLNASDPCPTLTSEAQTQFEVDFHLYLSPERKRCNYRPKQLPTCPDTSVFPLETPDLRSIMHYPEGTYVCLGQNTSCPSGQPHFSLLSSETLAPLTCGYAATEAFTMPRSCLEIKERYFAPEDGLYQIDPDGPGTQSSLVVYCDMTTDGGGWTLIGKGREGWAWTNDGRNAFEAPMNRGSHLGFSPAYYPAIAIDSILYINPIRGRTIANLSDGIRIRRSLSPSGDTYQEMRWHLIDQQFWSWLFDAGNGLPLEYVEVNDVFFEGSSTRDTYPTSNDSLLKTFTWPASTNNDQTGFAYGSAITGSDESETNFLWRAHPYGTTLPYSEVYIRR